MLAARVVPGYAWCRTGGNLRLNNDFENYSCTQSLARKTYIANKCFCSFTFPATSGNRVMREGGVKVVPLRGLASPATWQSTGAVKAGETMNKERRMAERC